MFESGETSRPKFNIAEVVGTANTDPAVFDRIVEYGTAIGMVPINNILSVQMPRVLPPSMRNSAPVR